MTLRLQHALGIVLNQCQFCKQTFDASCTRAEANFQALLYFVMGHSHTLKGAYEITLLLVQSFWQLALVDSKWQ